MFTANPRGHQLVRSWNGHRACQHCLQLRHAWRHRHLSSSCCQSWTFRNQGLLKVSLFIMNIINEHFIRVWPLLSYLTRLMPRCWMRFKIVSRSTLQSYPRKSTSPLISRDVKQHFSKEDSSQFLLNSRKKYSLFDWNISLLYYFLSPFLCKIRILFLHKRM